MTEITQADRDAAARAFASEYDVPMDCAVCKAILSGEEDDQEIVTRFVRHRMEERAAIADKIERELAMTALANVEASSDWIDGFEHAWKRVRAVLGEQQ